MKTNIIIGSDPEFAIIDNYGKKIDAYYLFDPIKFEVCKHSRNTSCSNPCTIPNLYCGHNRLSPEIGADCGFGELRPVQANNPLEHRDNIEHLIKVMQIPDGYKLLAGTHYGGSALGGHIHFGMPYESRGGLSHYLSYYCGIPLKKIEISDDLRKRGMTEGCYGYFGTYHEKSYGIEWRMPASWLVSREITTAALCLAYVVANQYTIQNDHRDNITHSDYLGLLTGDISHIIADIEKMDIYNLYYKEIEPIFQLIINNLHWDVKQDFRDRWI